MRLDKFLLVPPRIGKYKYMTIKDTVIIWWVLETRGVTLAQNRALYMHENMFGCRALPMHYSLKLPLSYERLEENVSQFLRCPLIFTPGSSLSHPKPKMKYNIFCEHHFRVSRTTEFPPLRAYPFSEHGFVDKLTFI